MDYHKIDWKHFFVGFLVGAISAWVFGAATGYISAGADKPAYATYEGTVVSISKADNRGKIDDGAGKLYAFRIPASLASNYIDPNIGDVVRFDVSSARSKNAYNVRLVSGTGSMTVNSFSVIENANGSVSFSWETTGPVSGYISYIKADTVPAQVDVTSSLASGFMTVTGTNVPELTVSGRCATINIFSGEFYTGDVVSNTQCSGGAPAMPSSKSFKQ